MTSWLVINIMLITRNIFLKEGVAMRIGIFGGSFNPPHLMHLQIGLSLLGKKYVDKIIYVPTGSKYKYKNNLVADEHRYKMLELMIKNDVRFEVSDYELPKFQDQKANMRCKVWC